MLVLFFLSGGGKHSAGKPNRLQIIDQGAGGLTELVACGWRQFVPEREIEADGGRERET